MNRVVLIDEDNYELSYELFDNQPYLHFVVAEWNPTIRKECIEHFEDIKIYFKQEGYTKMYAAAARDNKRLQKFIGLFNFKIDQELLCYNLYSQEIV